MQNTRKALILVLAFGLVVLALSPAGRSAASEKLAAARRLASRRFTDRETRASHMASERWEGEGGAIPVADARTP